MRIATRTGWRLACPVVHYAETSTLAAGARVTKRWVDARTLLDHKS
jgi:hypothetical protein